MTPVTFYKKKPLKLSYQLSVEETCMKSLNVTRVLERTLPPKTKSHFKDTEVRYPLEQIDL